MALSEALDSLLPYLRRYARALTGRQSGGDQLVEKLLERLLEKPEGVRDRVSIRAALYGNLGEIQDEILSKMDALPDYLRVANMPGRRALLLTAMEGLSEEEAGDALGMPANKVAAAAAAALTELMQSLATSAMIIEDEPFIAYDMRQILSGLGHEVCATATTRVEAVAQARSFSPSLILADVRLADESSGIDAVAEIQEFCSATVVFVTAYPERLLTGEGQEPAFLIPKPFNPETVQTVICQALLMKQIPQ